MQNGPAAAALRSPSEAGTKYYPIFLDLRARPCLVIGADETAAHKAESLRSAGARVKVIAERPCPALLTLQQQNAIELLERPYQGGDLDDVALTVLVSDDLDFGRAIAADARKSGSLLNVVDRPELCQFITPALVERGDLLIAVSTSGASPALAKRIRGDLEKAYGDEYRLGLKVLRAVRRQLIADDVPGERRQAVFKQLAGSPLCRYLRDGRRSDVDRLLADTVGPGISLQSLGLDSAARE